MHTVNDIGSTVIEIAIFSFRANKGWADKAVAQLSDDKLHVALDLNTNSIAVMRSPGSYNFCKSETTITPGNSTW